ncbi:MAG: ATP-binding protein [Parvularcula sp.]|jgi:anti-sigma regulatory factor (Ser/Thr protein kinase)|nr:ATP-binding protein [Parvularcula sp.]
MDHPRRFSAFLTKGSDPSIATRQALKFAREFLPESNLDQRGKVKIAIIVEELVSNAFRHGGHERDVSMALSLAAHEGFVALEMEDDAPAFDPTDKAAFIGPDPLTGGGIGLAIVRAWGEDLRYWREGQRNIVRLVIR